jgi:hypothetical protein
MWTPTLLDVERLQVLRSSISYVALSDKEASFTMLWTIAVILLVLWALGMVSSYTLGGFIHLLLVLAIIVVLIRVIQGRSLVA